MYFSVIGKIEKAKRYADKKSRITFDSFVAEFNSENHDHCPEYGTGKPGLFLPLL